MVALGGAAGLRWCAVWCSLLFFCCVAWGCSLCCVLRLLALVPFLCPLAFGSWGVVAVFGVFALRGLLLLGCFGVFGRLGVGGVFARLLARRLGLLGAFRCLRVFPCVGWLAVLLLFVSLLCRLVCGCLSGCLLLSFACLPLVFFALVGGACSVGCDSALLLPLAFGGLFFSWLTRLTAQA